MRQKWKKNSVEVEEHCSPFVKLPVEIFPLISGKGDELEAAAAVILLPCDFLLQIVLEGGVGLK